MRRFRRILAIVLPIALLTAGGVWAWRRGWVGEIYDRSVGITRAWRQVPFQTASSSPSAVFHVMPRQAEDQPFAGDPVNGARLYSAHCITCHGSSGLGDGPARAILHPTPRIHRDGAWMNGRSDDDLHSVILDGGGALNGSKLMPPFKDLLDPLDAWDLVAYLRTLHAPAAAYFPSPSMRFEFRETVLSSARLDRVQQEIDGDPGSHYASWLEVSAANQTGDASSANSVAGLTSGRLAFDVVDGPGAVFEVVVALDAGNHVLSARSYPEIELVANGRCVATADELLADAARPDSLIPNRANSSSAVDVTHVIDALRKRVRSLAARTREAAGQHDDDVAEAVAAVQRFDEAPESLPLGERLFMRSCASCHGARGRPLVPGATPNAVRGTLLSDGELMNPLGDGFLGHVIHDGGLATYVSTSMPQADLASEVELRAVVEFIRSLAVPSFTRP